jgi:hypothetical protein
MSRATAIAEPVYLTPPRSHASFGSTCILSWRGCGTARFLRPTWPAEEVQGLDGAFTQRTSRHSWPPGPQYHRHRRRRDDGEGWSTRNGYERKTNGTPPTKERVPFAQLEIGPCNLA